MKFKKGIVPIALLVVAVIIGIAVVASINVSAQKSTKARPVNGIFGIICAINPNFGRCLSTPSSYQYPTPQPEANKISWSTPYASLEADMLTITIRNKTFSGQGKITRLVSDPGNATYQTLEVEWSENNTPMRLYLYFSADGKRWKVSELRTYNGQNPGGWIYYPGFDGNFLGQPLEKENFELKGSSRGGTTINTFAGVIRFKNLKLQAFKTPTGCYQNPKLTLTPSTVASGGLVTASVERPQGCVGINLVSVENHSYFGPNNPGGPIGQCSFSSEGQRSCQVIFKAPTEPNNYYFQAGMDIDDNGTFDTWSSGSTLIVTSNP